ncbi:MAG TPA: VWA domain-containing protein [Bryobacteraceae bacterium]|jgi:VWFA-related protein|nr:VWA domain-containing protein [Bryobacteraceae bacterium]
MYRLLTQLLIAIPVLSQETTIRTTVPLVTIPVSVTDASGNPVEDISATDFVLLDNGRPRPVKVDVLESGISPISFIAIVQTSNMSLAAIAKIRKIGSMIPLAVVGANGAAALVAYDAEVKVVEDFTADADAITEAFSRLKAADATTGHMLDAVDCALDMLAAQPGGHRRNILIIGEAKDRGSKAKLDTIVQKLQRTGTTVYSMNYSKLITPFTMQPDEYEPTGDYLQAMIELARLAKRNTMSALTETTGGKRFGFETKAGLERDLMLLSKDIHNRYLLSFTPAVEQTSTFHKIEIKVKNAPGAITRARTGYWSTTQ